MLTIMQTQESKVVGRVRVRRDRGEGGKLAGLQGSLLVDIALVVLSHAPVTQLPPQNKRPSATNQMFHEYVESKASFCKQLYFSLTCHQT